MLLEITYTYTQDKYTSPVTGWTYYTSKSDDLKVAIGEAGKHFKKFVTANGWSKKAILKSISTLKNETSPPDHRVITPDPPKRRSPPKKKRSPSPSLKSQPRKNNKKSV